MYIQNELKDRIVIKIDRLKPLKVDASIKYMADRLTSTAHKINIVLQVDYIYLHWKENNFMTRVVNEIAKNINYKQLENINYIIIVIGHQTFNIYDVVSEVKGLFLFRLFPKDKIYRVFSMKEAEDLMMKDPVI